MMKITKRKTLIKTIEKKEYKQSESNKNNKENLFLLNPRGYIKIALITT